MDFPTHHPANSSHHHKRTGCKRETSFYSKLLQSTYQERDTSYSSYIPLKTKASPNSETKHPVHKNSCLHGTSKNKAFQAVAKKLFQEHDQLCLLRHALQIAAQSSQFRLVTAGSRIGLAADGSSLGNERAETSGAKPMP